MNTARFMTSAPKRPSRVAREVEKLSPWFHNLRLPDGTETAPDHPLGNFPANQWGQIEPHLPRDLDGWTVLDVGCNAGFYSFELALRGARVTAIDSDLHFLNQARWAALQFDLRDRISFQHATVYDMAQQDEVYDLIWFMGVFYHLRYPLLALDILAPKTRALMMFQTMTVPGDAVDVIPEDQDFDDRSAMTSAGWPKMAFIEHSMAGDPTNWWAPNHAGVEAMLRSAGMDIIARPGHEMYLCAPAPSRIEKIVARHKHELYAATGRSPRDS